MLPTFAFRRASRRAFVLAAAALSIHGPRSPASAQWSAPTPTYTGECSLEPGVQLLVDWRLGVPVMSMAEQLPGNDWALYTHPTLPLVFYYPPDWTPVALWAEDVDDHGVPVWTDQPPVIPTLSLARIVSPDQDAVFEFAVGNVTGPVLAPHDAALVAKQGLVGEDPDLREICLYEDQNPLAPSWFHADRLDRAIIVSSGVAIGNPQMFIPSTTVTYQNIIGPRRDFEDLVREVFIPILFQFIGKSGENEPTPEPDD